MQKSYRISHLFFSFVLLCSFWQVALNPDAIGVAEARIGTEVGDEAPNFSLPNTDNQIITLSNHRGEAAVILIFYRGQW